VGGGGGGEGGTNGSFSVSRCKGLKACWHGRGLSGCSCEKSAAAGKNSRTNKLGDDKREILWKEREKGSLLRGLGGGALLTNGHKKPDMKSLQTPNLKPSVTRERLAQGFSGFRIAQQRRQESSLLLCSSKNVG